MDDTRDADPTDGPALIAVMEPLRGLLGTWQGAGEGSYPTIDAFRYLEEVQFWHVGKPFLGYHQRTRHPDTGLPMHTESGFWRVVSDLDDRGAAAVEATLAHPTGLTEILVGEVRHGQLSVRTIEVARTPTAKDVSVVERSFAIDGDDLRYEVSMAAMGQPLQFHLRATLHRVA